MLSFEGARAVADHLRAKSEVERAPLAGFLILLLGAALAALVAPPANLGWTVGLLGLLLLGPGLLNRVLPGRNLLAYRLSLVVYPLNALLLALIVYLQIAGWEFVPSEDFPNLAKLLPWSGLIAGGAYGILQFPHWMRRVSLYSGLVAAREPLAPDRVAEVELLLDEMKHGEGATFRSVPTTPRNWSLFLKLDTRIHGLWHVAFAPNYALVMFHDGSGLEAVPKKGLKLVAEDLKPGEENALCLIRWNQHLFEGRISPGDFTRITEWNSGTKGQAGA